MPEDRLLLVRASRSEYTVQIVQCVGEQKERDPPGGRHRCNEHAADHDRTDRAVCHGTFVPPFIGLFGTVWGIMRSFEGIAAAQNTSLAVVAPGIAEALFATAMGLAAAIPAVVAYNKITVDLGRFAGRMQGLIGRSGGLLARAGVEA